ncbi:unnamed protein product [Scytosiphon promiscuus]
MEQEDEMEASGSRRTDRRKSRNQGKAESLERADDVLDLENYFGEQSDWRDSPSSAAATEKARSKAAPAQQRGGQTDLAAQLVAGLGLKVVAPSPPRSAAGAAVSQLEAEAEQYRGDGEGGEESIGEEDGSGAAGRLGGWFDDGQNASRRERTRAIRKEEKEGKSPEKVIAMVVSAAERDGVRDDRCRYCRWFDPKRAVPPLPPPSSLPPQEFYLTYLEDDELEHHDRMTTAGLAVACLRAGEESSAMAMLESAVRPYSSSAGESAAGGEVLPELLDYYLERSQKESSQEAAAGVRGSVRARLAVIRLTCTGARSCALKPTLSRGMFHKKKRFLANQLIRRLGKADRLSDAFEVLDGMARLGVENNHETLEFATNAAVKEVEFETRAISMKTLPSGKAALPEVVFVGRSNVGKSSLVNMLVNRKALAPTSAVPGFTQHFNYYAVNKGRRKSPSFFLVDVPGLGYARADDGRMDSWKSTLQRYLGVRESLRVVFHLIDGRTGLQKADEQLISLMMNENEGRSSYVMVVTKCDKVNDKQLKEVTERVRQALDKNGFPKTTPVIATSAKSRHGRVELLGYLRLVFDVDRRKGKGTGAAAAAAAAAAAVPP